MWHTSVGRNWTPPSPPRARIKSLHQDQRMRNQAIVQFCHCATHASRIRSGWHETNLIYPFIFLSSSSFTCQHNGLELCHPSTHMTSEQHSTLPLYTHNHHELTPTNAECSTKLPGGMVKYRPLRADVRAVDNFAVRTLGKCTCLLKADAIVCHISSCTEFFI